MAAPAWRACMGSHAPTGSPPSAPPLCRVSASHARVITLPHRLQVLRAVAHVAPWWLYPLCMLALLIPACASAGVHGGRVLAARSPCPCPYPCPYPWPCPRPCPSSRTQGAPSWLRFSHGALLARQASAPQAAARSLHAGPARGLGVSPLATRHTPRATRHTPYATQACATPSTSSSRATASGSSARWRPAGAPPCRTRSTSSESGRLRRVVLGGGGAGDKHVRFC